jgi:chemotaxis protein MotA
MKAITAIGIGAAIGGILIGAMMEGTQPMALFNIPALLIVLGGTLGATMAGNNMERMKGIPVLYKKAMGGQEIDLNGAVAQVVRFAETARRDGLLALEDQVDEIDDEFTKKGLQLLVDGTDPELVRSILENEIDGMSARHAAMAKPFEQAGGFAPTMGVLGTVMGLVHVLANLDKPETLGPLIAGAFIATLYGVGAANVIFLPVNEKLKTMSEEEVELRYLILEGLLSVQAGDNPRVIADKLLAFVPPEARVNPMDKPKAPAAGVAAQPAEAAA